MAARMTSLGVFARAPIAGATKTRLIPALGAEAAARLHECFLRDLLARVSAHPDLETTLWVSGEIESVASIAADHSVRVRRQPAGDLGARMEQVFAEELAARDTAIIIGSDSPTLPLALIEAARHALAEPARVVLGPSADGGYYLVGLRPPIPLEMFREMPWSTPLVFQETVRRCRDLGTVILPPWYDVDTPSDLLALRAHLALDRAAAPHTYARLFSEANSNR